MISAIKNSILILNPENISSLKFLSIFHAYLFTSIKVMHGVLLLLIAPVCNKKKNLQLMASESLRADTVNIFSILFGTSPSQW